tara:strand:+ start:507 stop:704 length:198 start_codon:yes stop_codon:yes gene_type:complete
MLVALFIASGCIIVGLSITIGVMIGLYFGAQRVEAKVMAYIQEHPTLSNIRMGEKLFNSHQMHRE